MSDSVQPHKQQPTRLRCPWDSPGKNTGVGCHFLLQCKNVKCESEVAQSFPTLRDLMDCSLPGSSTHGIFQARTLEWGAIAFSNLQARSRLLRHKSYYHFPLKTPRPTSGKDGWHKGSLTVHKESSLVFPGRSQNLALLVTCQNKECPCLALRAPSWGCT